MSAAVVVILVALIAGLAYGRSYRSAHETKRSNTGWYGLGLLALLVVGLWSSGRSGNEPAAYGFGIAIALTLAIMVLVGVASAVGRAMRKRKDGPQ